MDPPVKDQIQQLRQIIEAHEQQIQELRTLLLRRRRPKPSLPDPDKFTGAPFTWDTWLPLIKAKLRIDGEAIGGPEAQFFYTYGRLDDKVQALVSPQLQAAEESQQYDPDSLLKQLARIYDNPNKIRDAEDKLQTIKQGEDSLQVFLAKFEQVLYKAKANTWPDIAKIALLRRGLNRPTRTRLEAQILVPEEYNKFVATLQKLSGPAGNPMDTQIGALFSVKARCEAEED